MLREVIGECCGYPVVVVEEMVGQPGGSVRARWRCGECGISINVESPLPSMGRRASEFLPPVPAVRDED